MLMPQSCLIRTSLVLCTLRGTPLICVQLLPVSSSGIEASGHVDVVSEAWICSYMMYTKSDKVMREREKIVCIYMVIFCCLLRLLCS